MCVKAGTAVVLSGGGAAADVALVVLRIVITATANFIVIAAAIGPVITIVAVVMFTDRAITSAIIFYFDRRLELTQGFRDVVGVKGNMLMSLALMRFSSIGLLILILLGIWG